MFVFSLSSNLSSKFYPFRLVGEVPQHFWFLADYKHVTRILSIYFSTEHQYFFQTPFWCTYNCFKDSLPGLRIFLTTERSLKMMEIVFCFMLKAFSVLKIFNFLSWRFGHKGKYLGKKLKAIFKFYDDTDWQWIITIHILLRIFRRKDYQAMIFDQLIEYNVRNIYIKKLSRKWSILFAF